MHTGTNYIVVREMLEMNVYMGDADYIQKCLLLITQYNAGGIQIYT